MSTAEKIKKNNRDFFSKMESLIIVKVIRDGLVHLIPVLIIGAFALVVKSFPDFLLIRMPYLWVRHPLTF